jgi:hypothetical protein
VTETIDVPIAGEEMTVASREDARSAVTQFLMTKVRADRHPSSTYMDMIEESIPQSLLPAYHEILLGKVMSDRFPSIPMLRRIQRVERAL